MKFMIEILNFLLYINKKSNKMYNCRYLLPFNTKSIAYDKI